MQNGNLQQSVVDRRKSKVQTSFLTLIVGITTCVYGAQDQMPTSHEQSLGELAHKKSVRKAKTVITNDDLPSRAVESSNSADAPRPLAVSGESNSSEERGTHNAIDPELKVPGSLAEARSTMETLELHEQQLIRRYDEIQRKLRNTENEQLRRVYSDALAGREENLALIHKQIAEAEKAVRLAEEAGKAQGGQTDAPK